MFPVISRKTRKRNEKNGQLWKESSYIKRATNNLSCLIWNFPCDKLHFTQSRREFSALTRVAVSETVPFRESFRSLEAKAENRIARYRLSPRLFFVRGDEISNRIQVYDNEIIQSDLAARRRVFFFFFIRESRSWLNSATDISCRWYIYIHIADV